mmetsp:Transcript_7439/g.10732  ORF Transcript_7439/g.10732 Transcript_7439/m.10732 type:complete len:158 (-) Transcript_7439:419-892(-)
MAANKKVKKTLNKQAKKKAAKAKANVAQKTGAALPTKVFRTKGKKRRDLIQQLADGAKASGLPNITEEELKAKQTKEWKEMKAKVALLKKQRHDIPTKGFKKERAALAQEIRELMHSLDVRHQAELKAMGFTGSSTPSAAGAKGGDAAMNDADDDEL